MAGMSKIALGVALAAAAASGVVILQQSQNNAELRAEIGELRSLVERQARGHAAAQAEARKVASAPVAPIASPTEGLSVADREELARVRAEVAELKKQAKEFGTRLAQQAQPAGGAKPDPLAAIPTKLVRIVDMKNAGRATPEATAETLFWSAAGGEVDTLASTFMFAEPARAKAEAWFATLSEATRQQYGSPEKLIALMVARDAASLSGMQVIAQVPVNDTDVGMRLRMGTDDGKVKDEKFLLHRSADGWRVVLPENVIEKYARQLSGGKK